MDIVYRVLDAFPSGSYGLLALFRLLDVIETAEVETAAVECRAMPRLLINPAFVEAHAETPEKLLILVMHELHHVLLGHTRLFPRTTPLDNLIFDAVINSLLCRMFPAREHTSFFTAFYREDRLPECFLRPPRNWNPGSIAVPAAIRKSDRRLEEVYRALYSEAGVSYEELRDVLAAAVSAEAAAAVTLIGDHEGDLPELGPNGLLFDAVRAIVEHWPQPPNPIRGRSWSDLVRAADVKPAPVRSNRAILRALLTRVAGRGTAVHVRRPSDRVAHVSTPVPGFSRRSAVLRALGVPQLLYETPLSLPCGMESADRIHVYLDVSGSVTALLGALYGAVLDCREMVARTVHLFSTAVHDVTLEQLRRGVCQTTGGTAIECVGQHMRANRIRRAVIVTDGYVGAPGPADAETLRSAVTAAALTPGNATRHDLEGTVRHWAQLHGGF